MEGNKRLCDVVFKNQVMRDRMSTVRRGRARGAFLGLARRHYLRGGSHAASCSRAPPHLRARTQRRRFTKSNH